MTPILSRCKPRTQLAELACGNLTGPHCGPMSRVEGNTNLRTDRMESMLGLLCVLVVDASSRLFCAIASIEFLAM